MMVVVKDGKIEYITRNASTLPDDPDGDNGLGEPVAVVKDGVYRYGSGEHKESYAAMRVLDPDGTVDQGNEPMPVYRKGKSTTGTAFNIHAGDTDAPSIYSIGCQIILVTDYIDFGKAVGFINSTYKQSDYSSYKYLDGYTDEQKNIYIEKVNYVEDIKITYVLDRDSMTKDKKEKFHLP
jgi:hypothetical protein